MKLFYIKDKIKLFVILSSFFVITWLSTYGFPGIVASIIFLLFIFAYIFLKISKNLELSSVLIISIMLSVFQNIYLGIFSIKLSAIAIQLLTVLNFIISVLIFVMLLTSYINSKKFDRKNLYLFLTLVIYCGFSIIFLNEINFMSIISSLRNIISIFIFYIIGNLAVDRIDIKKFEMIIIFIGLVTIIFGFYEKFFNPNLWENLNITELWTKKGITLQSSGLPTNFYSSETINGQRIRRVTSTFADPVNFGTFLFAIFCISWFNKNKILILLSILAIALTISKGAFLGVLIFICVYFFFFSRKNFIWAASIMGIIGLGFLIYAYKTSANSVFLHISGFTSAITAIFKNPLGDGIGSTGVISKQFSGYTANSDITETGLGMIIGQLGIIGLIIYLAFFKRIFNKCKFLKEKREKVLCFTLFFSILINIFFNEVALSPNSCAIYFILLGYYLNCNKVGEENER